MSYDKFMEILSKDANQGARAKQDLSVKLAKDAEKSSNKLDLISDFKQTFSTYAERQKYLRSFQGKFLPNLELDFDDFLSWCEDEDYVELIKKKVFVMSPVGLFHQDFDGFLYRIFIAFVEKFDLGKVIIPPFLVKVGENGREPDLIYISEKNLPSLKETHYDGAPDLLVEIVSESSRVRDRGEKFYEYEAAGVKEYWLIDPLRKNAELYSLNQDGIYKILSEKDGKIASKVLAGLHFEMSWVESKKLPNVADIVKNFD